MADGDFHVVTPFQVAEDAVGVDMVPTDADSVTVAAAAIATDRLDADEDGSMHQDSLHDAEDVDVAMHRDEAATSVPPDSPWTLLAAMNEHPAATFQVAKKVHMGGISMTFIESEGQANKVPRAPARALASAGASSSHSHGASGAATPPAEEDDNASIMHYLAGSIAKLAGRVTMLEAQLTEVTTASASQPAVDPGGASSASGTWRKQSRSAAQYRVPQRSPWQMNSGWCNRCGLTWASTDSTEHFTVCRDVWETVMNRIYNKWTEGDDWCYMNNSYQDVATHVAQSLSSSGALPEHDLNNVASRFRRIWKPDINNDANAFFLYHAGKGMNKYITFGCIRCQRATTLYTFSATFAADLRRYFP